MDDATRAAKELNGINFQTRYLVLNLYRVDKEVAEAAILAERKEALEELMKENNVEDESSGKKLEDLN